MLKKFSFLICVILLSGCWDERQYKDISVVPIVGHDGKIGEINSYFTIPIIKDETPTVFIVEGKGASIREALMDANLKTSQSMDVSKLTVILFSDETVKTDIYEYLDVYYRNARNQLSTYIGITEGSAKPYLELGNEIQDDAGAYFHEYIEALERVSIYPETDLQMICSLLFDEGIDVILPYFKISEDEKSADIKGIALFNGKSFTGDYINNQEAITLTVLRDKIGRNASYTYMFEGTPITAVIRDVKKKWDFNELETSNSIKLSYTLRVDVQEFSRDQLKDKQKRNEIEQFLSKKIEEEVNKLLVILQESKSDPLGLGRRVRAFHPDVWETGKWKETYSTLKLEPSIKVIVERTGILH
jgi:Ger(x)C family germination protein